MLSTRGLADTDRPTHSELRLDRVPELSEVPCIARRARKVWGLRPKTKLDLRRVCDRLDIEVSVVPMEVPDGGAQGFLIPRSSGGFRIEVDPEPRGGWRSVSPPLRRQLRRHRRRFLVAHELTHTFFYEDGPNGPRRVVFDSSHQETFCDELARALLVPHEAAAKMPFEPESVVEIQRRFDVSMEVALRALAATHADTGAAWLLLRRREETFVQWTSAEQSLTPRALGSLCTLATNASREGEVETTVTELHGRVRARHLPDRAQVIVTADRRSDHRPPTSRSSPGRRAVSAP